MNKEIKALWLILKSLTRQPYRLKAYSDYLPYHLNLLLYLRLPVTTGFSSAGLKEETTL